MPEPTAGALVGGDDARRRIAAGQRAQPGDSLAAVAAATVANLACWARRWFSGLGDVGQADGLAAGVVQPVGQALGQRRDPARGLAGDTKRADRRFRLSRNAFSLQAPARRRCGRWCR